MENAIIKSILQNVAQQRETYGGCDDSDFIYGGARRKRTSKKTSKKKTTKKGTTSGKRLQALKNKYMREGYDMATAWKKARGSGLMY